MPRVPIPAHLAGGPFTYAQGRTAGLGHRRLYGSDLHRPFHGIRTLAVPAGTLQRALALAPRLPPGAFFCSATAAALSGVPLPPHLARRAELHAAIPAPGRALRVAGVRGHVIQVQADSVAELHGLRLSAPAQLWVELGAVLALEDLVAAGDHLVHHRWPTTSIPRLTAAVASTRQRRGLRTLRRALALLDERAESPQESRLRVLLLQQGMSHLQSNVPVRASSGHNYRIDLALRDEMVAIEYQGEYHNDRAQFHRDMTKRERLQADGWIVMWVNAADLQDPQELAQRIRRTIDTSRRR